MDKEEVVDQLTEARQQVQLFRALQASPGWAALVEVAQAQISHRRQKYNLVPLKTTDGLLEQQWELGEASGIELFLRLPQSIIDGGEAIITERMQNEPRVAESDSE